MTVVLGHNCSGITGQHCYDLECLIERNEIVMLISTPWVKLEMCDRTASCSAGVNAYTNVLRLNLKRLASKCFELYVGVRSL